MGDSFSYMYIYTSAYVYTQFICVCIHVFCILYEDMNILIWYIYVQKYIQKKYRNGGQVYLWGKFNLGWFRVFYLAVFILLEQINFMKYKFLALNKLDSYPEFVSNFSLSFF